MGSAPRIAVVGVHGGEAFGTAAGVALRGADVVVGSARQLALLPTTVTARRVELVGAIDVVVDDVARLSTDGLRVCVLAAGDPGFFGIARLLATRFGPDALDIHPAPSSVSLAFARVGLPWDDAVVVSCHGRSLADIVAPLWAAAKAAVLVGPDTPPEAVGAAMVTAGLRPRRVWVASHLGEPDENVVETDLDGLAAGVWPPMSVVLVVDSARLVAPTPSVKWGAPDDGFLHRDGMITKSEVRAVVLSKLGLHSSAVMWDVGAGSGSVGIEAARLAPGLRLFAIEQNVDDCQRIRANADTAGVSMTVVEGHAPDAFTGLPDPHVLFVGGGGAAVLSAALARLRPGGSAVSTYATIGPALAAAQLLGNLVQVQINRASVIGTEAEIRLVAQNPVFVAWKEPA